MSTQEGSERPDPPEPLHVNSNLTARVIRQKIWQPANVENDWCCFVIVGREGSGKSHTTLSILEKADPSFTADRVHFDAAEFLRTVNNIPAEKRQGKAVMIDEAGVSLGVRSWYEEDQIKFNQAMQTARDDNMIVGSTLPRLTELDSQFRGRLHGFCEMRNLEEGEYAEWSWKNVDPTRDERNKLYKKYPRMRVNGRKRRITRLRIGPPSEELAEEYEEKKAEFKRDLYAETIDQYDDDEEEELEPSDVAEAVIAGEHDIDQYISEHTVTGRQYIDNTLLKSDFGLSHRDSKEAKNLIEREVDLNEE